MVRITDSVVHGEESHHVHEKSRKEKVGDMQVAQKLEISSFKDRERDGKAEKKTSYSTERNADSQREEREKR